jgi:hypothetical protein
MTTATMTEATDSLDDLLDNPAYESEVQSHYLDRYRKVPVGPSLTLLFENARTLRFRIREARSLGSSGRPLLAWYASLKPREDRICASVLVRRPGRRPTPGLFDLGDAIREGTIRLLIGDREVRAVLRSGRAGDRILGNAFWITFPFDDDAREALQDFTTPAYIQVDAEGYSWLSEPLGYEVRSSLVDDLLKLDGDE